MIKYGLFCTTFIDIYLYYLSLQQLSIVLGNNLTTFGNILQHLFITSTRNEYLILG